MNEVIHLRVEAYQELDGSYCVVLTFPGGTIAISKDEAIELASAIKDACSAIDNELMTKQVS